MNKIDKFEFRKTIVEIVISLVSTVLVLLTLFEMQEDRNAAYRPDVSFSDTTVAITWEDMSTEEPSESFSTVEPEEDSISTLYDSLSESYAFNAPTELQMYNIGVGTAKDVTLKWDHEANVAAFIKAFSNYENVNVSLQGNILYVESPSLSFGQGVGTERIAEFMLSSTEESHNVTFPYAYSFLIRELLSRAPIESDFPTFSLVITYSDVQNKTYSKELTVTVENLLYAPGTSGSGLCLYNLHFTEDNNMPTLGLLSIDSDSLSAISATAAVIISIISMVFTIIYSHKQNEHNRNSVRPISAIRFDDYEDRIAVKIENAGTGPLLIKKLRLIHEGGESQTLISLMPTINQDWTTYTEEVDGWTIPVGGKITLIKIEPESNTVKTLVRKALSTITVSIDYTDIYSTEFHDERSLEFFGRHFE